MKSSFIYKLWFLWLKQVLSKTFILSTIISFFIVLILYISKGFVRLNSDVVKAIIDIFNTIFVISFAFIYTIIAFISPYFLQNICIDRYKFNIKSCKDDNKRYYSKFYRKWFISFVFIMMFLTLVISIIEYIFSNKINLSINTIVIYINSFISSYITLHLMQSRCKMFNTVSCY